MNVIEHFTIRSLKQNRKWTVATIIGIIISTAMVTAVATFFSSFMVMMQNTVKAQTGDWHAKLPCVSVADLKTIKNAGFVGSTMLTRDVGYAALLGSQNKARPYLFIEQFDTAAEKGFPTTLVAGRMPQNGSELAISQAVRTDAGVPVHVGEKLTLSVGERISGNKVLTQKDHFQQPMQANKQAGTPARPRETLVPRLTKTYTVVGIIKQPAFEPFRAAGYTAVSYLNDSTLKSGDKVDVSILAKNLNHSFYNKVDALAKSIGISPSSVSFNKQLLRYSGILSGANNQKMVYGFSVLLIAIIMIASISLIYNAFAISFSERTRQLGMLASIGATKRQKKKNVYFEGFLLGLVGIPLGILAGIAGIGMTISALRSLLSTFRSSTGLTLVVSPISIIVAAVIGVLTILISVWIPARRASKIMPIDAIRQANEFSLTRKAVKTSWITRVLFGFEGELALKNIKRSRKKYRATILSLIISLVLFLTVSSYAQTAWKVNEATNYGVNYDFSVTYYNTPTSVIQALNSRLAKLDSVKSATTQYLDSGKILMESTQLTQNTEHFVTPNKQGKYEMNVQLIGLDDISFEGYAKSIRVNPKDYENPKVPEAIIINYGTDSIGGVHAAGRLVTVSPGSTLQLENSSGTSESTVLKIGALTDKRPTGVLIGKFNPMKMVVSEDVFKSINAKLDNGKPAEAALFLTTDNNQRLQEQIGGIDGMSYLSPGQVAIMNYIALKEQDKGNKTFILEVFIYGFIILIGLISIANIFNTLSTNIGLRRKEFAMLRSVGMTPKSLNRMLRYESIFYGLKALLYGLPISVATALLLYYFQKGAFSFGFTLPWESYGAAIVLIFVIVHVVMFYASSKIKKENIVDTLKDETL
ncbi:FtsX-like permease family [Acididesulfobacillus acetoxydans]|uniref:ABC transporter, permease protein n=1 Tax=Acididesulfobacillus acetoxydans TaxID=1561005 RepID=A0A8S0VW68_9FIRM|nr:FtsX-like permease family protein [Acididesulfobacillus acetoxydans]CAA7600503.1 FtsX-like permease family [Acididesulfobacillus acetoxydans]CEJ06637.1 ABC transporter, permease protein [Acididesulfobacillus acetoxydans]